MTSRLVLTRLERSRVQWQRGVSGLVASDFSRSYNELLSYLRMAPRGGGPGGHWNVLGPRVTVCATGCSCTLAQMERAQHNQPCCWERGGPGDQLLRPRKKALHPGSFQHGDMATKDQTRHPLHGEATPGPKHSLWESWRAQK